jgi:hypothetical protein
VAEGHQLYGWPEKIGEAIGLLVSTVTFAVLAWAVLRNFI